MRSPEVRLKHGTEYTAWGVNEILLVGFKLFPVTQLDLHYSLFKIFRNDGIQLQDVSPLLIQCSDGVINFLYSLLNGIYGDCDLGGMNQDGRGKWSNHSLPYFAPQPAVHSGRLHSQRTRPRGARRGIPYHAHVCSNPCPCSVLRLAPVPLSIESTLYFTIRS